MTCKIKIKLKYVMYRFVSRNNLSGHFKRVLFMVDNVERKKSNFIEDVVGDSYFLYPTNLIR